MEAAARQGKTECRFILNEDMFTEDVKREIVTMFEEYEFNVVLRGNLLILDWKDADLWEGGSYSFEFYD